MKQIKPVKQTSFVVEILQGEELTIVVRDQRGIVVKIAHDPQELSSFCSEVLEVLNQNVESHEA